MILVDTSVWIDFFNGVQTAAVSKLETLLGSRPVMTGDLILIELLQGFRHSKDVVKARKLLECLEYRDMSNKELAYQSAENYRLLRKKGVTIRKTIDVMIATFCIENQIELLHSDRDFDPIQQYLGLKTVATSQ
jgi:predicted nucleic acid-binding protein